MSGTFPKWLEAWLGAGSRRLGRGHALEAARQLALAPLGHRAAGRLFRRLHVLLLPARNRHGQPRPLRLALATIRSLLVFIILFMLAQFMLSLERTGLPYVVVMVDDSQSMGIEDRYSDEKIRAAIAHELAAAGLDKPSRLNLAKSVLLADNAMLLRAIDERYKLKLYYLDDAVRGQSGSVDQLAAGLLKLHADRRIDPAGPGRADRAQ